MEVLLLLFALLSLSQATEIYRSPYYLSTGVSQQYRTQDNIGNYQFGYNEGHSSGGTFRRETGDAWGNKYGSYGLRDADGRYRVVNYVADAGGFRADVKSNEPGVAPKDSASTTVSKPLFYSPPASPAYIHHAAIPQFPLLYRPQYSSYNYYKGSPFRSNPYSSPKGTKYQVISPYPKYGYYVYP
ncbi:cuticle protein 14-like [Uloborus diversus]|uniref:cuticle protein 14-like n=1 Tax=Uloborus diversus TaxID=327109 RepID=UPI00240976CB|nr:cuticle protein 14-like [Uloborus diversus]